MNPAQKDALPAGGLNGIARFGDEADFLACRAAPSERGAIHHHQTGARTLKLTHAHLHHTILKHVVERGCAPGIAALAETFGQDAVDVRAALIALQAYHGVVLHPHNAEVWVIHPFSLAPTNFLLRKGDRAWWGNCAWCSLGAASLLGGDVTITTTLGADGEQVRLRVEGGRLRDRDYVVHFPIPMAEAWNNVVYTCSTMLLFRDRSGVEAWSRRHKLPLGDVQPAAVVFEFAKAWYGTHLHPAWRKWTRAEARELFERFGLAHPVWEIPASEGHF
jgi:hypothetical protein